MIYLGVSETHDAQLSILQALTRKFHLDPSLDLGSFASRCPFNFTGADFYALCSDAMLNAMSQKAEELETTIGKTTRFSSRTLTNTIAANLNSLPGPYEHPYPLTPQYYLSELALPQDIEVLVSQRDFDMALQSLVPSVSQSEMEHYTTIQRRFSRDMPDAPLSRDMNDLVASIHVDDVELSTLPNSPSMSSRKGKGRFLDEAD
jgi:peroxin-6